MWPSGCASADAWAMLITRHVVPHRTAIVRPAASVATSRSPSRTPALCNASAVNVRIALLPLVGEPGVRRGDEETMSEAAGVVEGDAGQRLEAGELREAGRMAVAVDADETERLAHLERVDAVAMKAARGRHRDVRLGTRIRRVPRSKRTNAS